ncbi:hypothetical protein LOF14_15375 [Klebsiella variicola subsp. variicola]|nr:hypothetical protein LOF14_15375 [Klebsiella variicola subsp. variicola]
MSGKQRFYDKQDQKRLDEDWLTGFDNRDRLNFLAKEIAALQEQVKTANAAFEFAKGEVGGFAKSGHFIPENTTN